MIIFRHQNHPIYMMLIWYCNYFTVGRVICKKWCWNISKMLGIYFRECPIKLILRKISMEKHISVESISTRVKVNKNIKKIKYNTEEHKPIKLFCYHTNRFHCPTDTPRWIHVDSTSISHRYVEDQISTNFHVISRYFFDVTLLIERSTSFPRTFFDLISLVEKSMLFPRTFFNVISMVKKSTLFLCTFFHVIFDGRKIYVISTYFFWCNFDCRKIHVVFAYFYWCNLLVEKSAMFASTFFDVISMVQKSTLFPRTFSDVICLIEISTLILLTFFDVITMGKNLTPFLVSCKLMKTFEEVFLCS